MTDQVKACKVKDWEGSPAVEVWKPAWFYGLTEQWDGHSHEIRAVVRFPGDILLKDFSLATVKLVEDSPPPPGQYTFTIGPAVPAWDPTEEVELEEELKRTQERLKRLRGILVQLHSYLTNYQGSGLSEGVAEDLCKILDYPDPIVEDK